MRSETIAVTTLTTNAQAVVDAIPEAIGRSLHQPKLSEALNLSPDTLHEKARSEILERSVVCLEKPGNLTFYRRLIFIPKIARKLYQERKLQLWVEHLPKRLDDFKKSLLKLWRKHVF